MAVKTKDNLDEIKNEDYLEMEVRINSIMKDIAEDLEKGYESAVETWYKSYDPKYYDRTYDTYFGSSGFDGYERGHISGNKINNCYSVKRTKDGFDGDAYIYVNPSRLHGYYEDSTDYVFNRSWSLGIHGATGTGGQTDSPESIMDKWFDGFKNNIYKYLRRHGL